MEGAGDQVISPANLLRLPPEPPTAEVSELLLQRPGIRLERILSTGQTSPPGFWYDQAEDEWVAVLQGEGVLQWEDGQLTELRAGDWLFIPAHQKHRVERTSITPPCIWLAIFVPQPA